MTEGLVNVDVIQEENKLTLKFNLEKHHVKYISKKFIFDVITLGLFLKAKFVKCNDNEPTNRL